MLNEVEGGFFRYATLPDWSKPHFEKMLDGNAGLLQNYLEAYKLTGMVIVESKKDPKTTTLFQKTIGIYEPRKSVQLLDPLKGIEIIKKGPIKPQQFCLMPLPKP